MKYALVGAGLVAAFSICAETWPFMTIRQTGGPAKMSEKMDEVIRINKNYPGSCDEYWFAHGAGPRLDICEREFAVLQRFRQPCVDAGIAVGFQQGVTLGHGSIYDPAGGGQAKADLHPFTDAAWQVGKKGQRLLMFCPRSPEVLAYEEKYVEALCRTLNPVSLWLDDDLRLGFSKPDGCFCDRCLKAFAEASGFKLSRAELVARLDGGAAKDDVRRAWRAFLSRSLAVYGVAARRGADRVNPNLRLAYQSVRPYALAAGGVDNFPLLAALSGEGRMETAIRVGDGCYFEDVDEYLRKAQRIAFEAERCRASKVRIGSISYEQETYTREVLHKSPEAAMIESAIALAAGCDALTEYWWAAGRDEPLSYYEEFAQTIAAWRPYLERVAQVTRKTRLGGTARFIGSDFDRLVKSDTSDGNDFALARIGVPVTVQPAGCNHYYFTAQSWQELGEGDLEKLLAAGVVVDVSVAGKLKKLGGECAVRAFASGRWTSVNLGLAAKRGVTVPTTAERVALLDAFDRVGELPVRIERTHAFRIFPRVDAEGRVVAATIFNISLGRSFPTRIQIRRPIGEKVVWVRPGEADRTLELKDGILEIPSLPGCQVATVFFSH